METIVDAVVKEEKKAKIAEAIVSSERDSTPPEVKKPVVVVTAQEEVRNYCVLVEVALRKVIFFLPRWCQLIKRT